MNRKKTLIVILSFLLFISSIPNVSRADSMEFGQIKVNSKDDSVYEGVIVKQSILYFPVSSIAAHTRYKFDKETETFYLKGQAKADAIKKVKLDRKSSSLVVLGQHYPVTDIIDYAGETYLPLTELLPLLNTYYWQHNTVLYVASDKLTLWDVLYKLELDKYVYDYFDRWKEEGANILWQEILGGTLNAIQDWRVDKLNPVNTKGNLNDYKDMLTSLVGTYESDFTFIVDAYSELADANKEVRDIYENFYITGVDLTQDYELRYAMGSKSIPQQLYLNAFSQMLGYFDGFYSKLDDDEDMLKLIYEDKWISSTNLDEAAKQVSEYYSGELFPVLSKLLVDLTVDGGAELSELVLESTLDGNKKQLHAFKQRKLSTGAWLKNAFKAKNLFLAVISLLTDVDKRAKDLSLIASWNDLISFSKNSYDGAFGKVKYGTVETPEQLRLALLLYLKASYGATTSVKSTLFLKQESLKYYNNKLDGLSKIIPQLHLVRAASFNDDYSTYTTRKDRLEESLAQVKYTSLKEDFFYNKFIKGVAIKALIEDYLAGMMGDNGKRVPDNVDQMYQNFTSCIELDWLGGAPLYECEEGLFHDRYYSYFGMEMEVTLDEIAQVMPEGKFVYIEDDGIGHQVLSEIWALTYSNNNYGVYLYAEEKNKNVELVGIQHNKNLREIGKIR